MKLVYLQSGYFSEPEIDPTKPSGPAESQNESMIEKEALLCYPGKFMSMDGEVEVSPEQLGRLADNHNSVLSKVKRMASGDIPLKDCPPIQLDHETKATHTVGRLVGNLQIKEAELSDGSKVPALFGKVRILGKENVEKVKDGRWIHLSIGADLEEGKLNELTITPFPAAQNAHMMSRFGAEFEVAHKEEYKGKEIIVSVAYALGSRYWSASVDGKQVKAQIRSKDDAISIAKQMIDTGKMSRLAHSVAKEGNYKGKAYRITVYSDDSPNENVRGKYSIGANHSGTFESISLDGKMMWDSLQEAESAVKKYIDRYGDKMSRLADEKVVHSATYKDDKYYIFIRDNKIFAQNDSTDKVIGPFNSVTEAESKIKSLIDDISGLSRFKEGDLKKSGVILGKHVDVFEDAEGKFVASVLEGGHVPGAYSTPDKAWSEAEKVIKSGKLSKLSEGEEANLAKDKPMKYGTIGKYAYKIDRLKEGDFLVVIYVKEKPLYVYTVDTIDEALEIIKEITGKKISLSKLSAPYHVKSIKYKNKTIDIYDMTEGDDEPSNYGFDIEDLDERMDKFKTEELAVSAAKKLIDKMKMSKLNGEESGVHIDINSHNIEEEEEEKMDYKSMKEKMAEYEKCKKHLSEMPKEDGSKMSEEEVEEKLASLADEDVKKMASEQDEKDKKLAAETDEDKEKKMSRLAKFKEFSTKIETAQKGVKLAQKKAKIAARLSSFKSTGKITPAEIKALDLDKMATESDEIVEAKLSTFSKRQPVIDARVHGSVRGMNIAEMSKELKMSSLEKDIRSRFTSIPKKKATKLSMEANENTESMGMAEESVSDSSKMGDLEIIHKMMGEGKHEEAMAKMSEHIEKMKKMSDGEEVGHASLEEKDVEKHLSALATANDTMENLNKEIQRFVADMVG